MAYSFLLSWRWAGWLLLAALFAAACIGLGNWQMERRNQTVAEIRRVQQNYDKTPVPFQDARAYFNVANPDAKWTTVAVSGRYLAEDQRIVRNRPNNSVAGYEVLVPFRLASGETIAINRGWLPIGNIRPGYPDAVPAPPAGDVSAVIRIKPSEPDLGRDAPEGQLASIDLPYYASQLEYPLLAGSYGVMASESPPPTAVDHLRRPRGRGLRVHGTTAGPHPPRRAGNAGRIRGDSKHRPATPSSRPAQGLPRRGRRRPVGLDGTLSRALGSARAGRSGTSPTTESR